MREVNDNRLRERAGHLGNIVNGLACEARICVREGNTENARRIYKALADVSLARADLVEGGEKALCHEVAANGYALTGDFAMAKAHFEFAAMQCDKLGDLDGANAYREKHNRLLRLSDLAPLSEIAEELNIRRD